MTTENQLPEVSEMCSIEVTYLKTGKIFRFLIATDDEELAMETFKFLGFPLPKEGITIKVARESNPAFHS